MIPPLLIFIFGAWKSFCAYDINSVGTVQFGTQYKCNLYIEMKTMDLERKKEERKIVYFLNNSLQNQYNIYYLNGATHENQFTRKWSKISFPIGYYLNLTLRALERPFIQSDLGTKGAQLRGTARIGLIALIPTQGPHAAYPHSYRCHSFFFFFSWDIKYFLNS